MHDVVAETVDFLALLVHHIVVLEGAFADLKVVLLDVLLRGLDGAVEQAAVADGFTLADAFLDEFEQAVAGGEEPQQVVLEGEKKTGGAGVALARAASTQLAVDAA